MSIIVRCYGEHDAEPWDKLTAGSWNGTFLHERRFLAYHGDRFQHLSLVIEDDGGRIIGVFPAALDLQHRDTVVSHPGLTYGGVVHKGALRGAVMLEVLQEICGSYRDADFRLLRYKAIPHIYHTVPSGDDLYALFRLGAVRYRCDLSAAIDFESRQEPSKLRLRDLAKARRAGNTDGPDPSCLVRVCQLTKSARSSVRLEQPPVGEDQQHQPAAILREISERSSLKHYTLGIGCFKDRRRVDRGTMAILAQRAIRRSWRRLLEYDELRSGAFWPGVS
jgi:hypothetical protein